MDQAMKTYKVSYRKNGESRIAFIDDVSLLEAKRQFRRLNLGQYYEFVQWDNPLTKVK